MHQASSLATRQDIASATRLDRILETLFDISVYEAKPQQCAATSTSCSAVIKVNNQYGYLLIINCADSALQVIYEKSSCFDDYNLGLDDATETLQFLVNYMAQCLNDLPEIQEPQYSSEEDDGIVIDKYYDYKGKSIHLIMAEMMGVMDPT